MYAKILSKEKRIAVVGLGYVGLPIALEFARQLPVTGFDINRERIEMMKKRIDPSRELPPEAFAGCDIGFTADPEDLKSAHFFIIAVPTPIDSLNQPNLAPLLSATATVGRALKRGDYVVYESTVYPGCTEEDCVPILERESGLKAGSGFKVGYSPERINPGDKDHTIGRIIKVVSGCDSESLDNIAKTYELIVRAGVHRAGSIKVAEAAKIIENTQRDLNIALMNELSMIFARMGIDTYDVLRAAGTKWNFLKFAPGLVGGHCIGVDPYYLTHKSKQLGYHAKVILSGREINDGMGVYIAKQVVKKIIAANKDIRRARALVMGITFKENVGDIRNSKVMDLINELRSYSVTVDVVDPRADAAAVKKEYGLELIAEPGKNYDAVIVAVAHKEYLALAEDYFAAISAPRGVVADLKGILKDKIKNLTYWSL